MAAGAPGGGQSLEDLGDAGSGVIHGHAHAVISYLMGLLDSAGGEDENTAGRQATAQLFYDRTLCRERDMPDAVPGGDEVVAFGQRPVADVRLMKGDVGMTLFRQPQHLGGEVQAFRLEALGGQQINEATAAAAADIKRGSAMGDEPQGTLMLRDTIRPMKLRTVPNGRDAVVTGGNFGGGHVRTSLIVFS